MTTNVMDKVGGYQESDKQQAGRLEFAGRDTGSDGARTRKPYILPYTQKIEALP